MKVLIACEESQEVCKAFRAKGHEAYSCDIQEPSGGHPEWHILGDALSVLTGGTITTMDGIRHEVGKWDLLIAHPPCTYLAVSGNRWFNVERYGDAALQRLANRHDAVNFFMEFALSDIPKIAIENPVGYMSTAWRKPDQIIQPYEYGHHARKTTCLWLKGLPKLQPTNVVDPGEIDRNGCSAGASATYAVDENGKIIPWNDPRTAKARSKTFPGIAKAMAAQWSEVLQKYLYMLQLYRGDFMKTKIEIGQKYNRLTVLEKLGYDKHNNRMYRCLCDCGNEIVLRGTAFTSGNTKSCGCLSKEVKKAKRLPNNQGVINHIILQYKRHARDRNLSWNLTYEQVEKIIQEPCFYCGTEKSNHKVTKNCKEGYDHNGIDRIDSSVGYEPNNVVSCCKICNYAKSNLTKDDFINWAIRVAEHSKSMAAQC